MVLWKQEKKMFQGGENLFNYQLVLVLNIFLTYLCQALLIGQNDEDRASTTRFKH